MDELYRRVIYNIIYYRHVNPHIGLRQKCSDIDHSIRACAEREGERVGGMLHLLCIIIKNDNVLQN